ncbi:uncharacterized protein [Solanum tuberosum]|uniref:Uncharacterized protein n=1 Tax=Solanum tuberosum TaxID=4113 RepID=M1B9X5_SOLTU|nr:PREDICTED: uncharacterized protein LOC102579472 [Solanum tuberosum]XP_049410523.1 uncharacterized protein LOC125873691 [Solanum stenotomum]
MENECNFPRKLRYDISMSKRTRKTAKEEDVVVESVEYHDEELMNNSDEKKSLKQLIEGRRTSLGHHFTEEERQVQIVVKQAENNGVKFKEMVSRYAKVLSHMIKLKRKKPAGYILKMQVHTNK